MDRSAFLSNNNALPLRPDMPGVATLFRVLGLLNPDASMSPNNVRKYHQINAMYTAIESALEVPLRDGGSEPLRLVDMCTGSASQLALIVCFAARRHWERPVHMLAIDADSTRIAAAKQRARLLGFGPDVLQHQVCTIAELDSWDELYTSAFRASRPEPPHAVFALHACDTATDEAIAYGVGAGADALLVAPCCQAELAAQWKQLLRHEAGAYGSSFADAAAFVDERHPFAAVHRMKHLRREVGASVTDTLRVLLLRASGYAVSTGDFVSVEHTPKNTLITALRQRGPTRSSARVARAVARVEYQTLRDATGGCGIALGRMLGVDEADHGAWDDE